MVGALAGHHAQEALGVRYDALALGHQERRKCLSRVEGGQVLAGHIHQVADYRAQALVPVRVGLAGRPGRSSQEPMGFSSQAVPAPRRVAVAAA